MVVPYEENFEKVVHSKLDTIIKDANIKNEQKPYMYNNELKKNLNRISHNLNQESIDSSITDINSK